MRNVHVLVQIVKVMYSIVSQRSVFVESFILDSEFTSSHDLCMLTKVLAAALCRLRSIPITTTMAGGRKLRHSGNKLT